MTGDPERRVIYGSPSFIHNMDGRPGSIDADIRDFAKDQLRQLRVLSNQFGNPYSKMFYVEYVVPSTAEKLNYTIIIKTFKDPVLDKVLITIGTSCANGETEFLFTVDPKQLKKLWPVEYVNRVSATRALAADPELEWFDEAHMPLSVSGAPYVAALVEGKDHLEIPAGLPSRAVGDGSGCVIWSIGSSALGYSRAAPIPEEYIKTKISAKNSIHSPVFNGDVGSNKEPNAALDPPLITKSFSDPGAVGYKQYSHAYDFTAFWNATIAASCPFSSAPRCSNCIKTNRHNCGWSGTLINCGGCYNKSLANCDPDGGDKSFGPSWTGWKRTGENCGSECVGRPCSECYGEGCIPTNCAGVPCPQCLGPGCTGGACTGIPCDRCPGEGCTGTACEGLPCSECAGEGCIPVCGGISIVGPTVLACSSTHDYGVSCSSGSCSAPVWSWNGVPKANSTVSAPGSNANCTENGVLSVECAGGATAAINISFNCKSGSDIATLVYNYYRYCRDWNLCIDGATDDTCVGPGLSYWRAQKYACDGTYITNGLATFSNGCAGQESVTINSSYVWPNQCDSGDCSPFHQCVAGGSCDARSALLKSQGCCPDGS